ncbi:MAG: hypothetical protein EU529_13050 [Promethearchaeota archaeon]|nr:MAG: hypothetical protein EU529_13050 [Candidatus Lokiarchaeota archaeon]
MREKTAVYICILNGILMVLNPIIGILLFFEGSSRIEILLAISSLYAGFSLIIAAILAKEDYSLLGVDYLKTGINLLKLAIIAEIISLVVLNIILIINIQQTNILVIIEIIIYNAIEIVIILITCVIIRNFKKGKLAHDHEEFSH